MGPNPIALSSLVLFPPPEFFVPVQGDAYLLLFIQPALGEQEPLAVGGDVVIAACQFLLEERPRLPKGQALANNETVTAITVRPCM